jgi:hypothetical protein
MRFMMVILVMTAILDVSYIDPGLNPKAFGELTKP